jgi:hypothetical protein
VILSKGNLKQLRLSIAAALILIGSGVASLIVAEGYVDAAKENRKSTQARKVSALDRVARASEEEKEIRANLVHYQKMVASGIVGARERLDLIDSIAAIKKARRLFEIKYSISPQSVLEYAGVQPTGSLDFVNSPMRIDMALLHEDDLLNFIEDLKASKQTHVVVRHCSMQRIAGVSLTSGPATPTIKAECLLDLINLLEVKPS